MYCVSWPLLNINDGLTTLQGFFVLGKPNTISAAVLTKHLRIQVLCCMDMMEPIFLALPQCLHFYAPTETQWMRMATLN